MQFRKMLCPGTKAHALDSAMDQDMEGSAVGHRLSAKVGMRGVGVAVCTIIERLDIINPHPAGL